MIQFNELRITPDSNYLIIDASIKEDIKFENYSISHINIYQIKDSKSFEEEPIYYKQITTEDIIVYVNGGSKVLVHPDETVYIENGVRRIRLKLSSKDLRTSLSNNLFKIHIEAISEDPSDLPINNYAEGVAMDLYPYYKEVLKYIKNFNCSCENKDLINAILKLKSLEISAKTGRFEQVAYYWFKYFK